MVKKLCNGLAMLVIFVYAATAYAHGLDPTHAAVLSAMGIGLATNYVQDGDHLSLTAPYARNAGEGAQIGSIFAVALSDVLNAAATEWATEGVWQLTALSTCTGSQGAKVYWDNTNKRVDTDSTVGILIGVLTAAKTNGQTTATVMLNEAVADSAEGPQAAIASLTEGGAAIGGTQNGDITALVDPAGDAGASLIDGVRENATKINDILVALRAFGVLTP